MSKQTANARPVCTWVPVMDATGRIHMEARWTTAPAVGRQAA